MGLWPGDWLRDGTGSGGSGRGSGAGRWTVTGLLRGEEEGATALGGAPGTGADLEAQGGVLVWDVAL